MRPSTTRRALIACAFVIASPLPALAYDPVTCGGEGERACGVEDAAFWRNGTGWCDSSLAADLQLPSILGGQTVVLYANRSTAWLDLKNFNDLTVRDLLASWKDFGEDLGAIVTNPRDWFEMEKIDDVCFDPCPGDIDCEICFPLYGPVLADDVINLASELGSAFGSFGPFFDEIGDFKTGGQIPFDITGSFSFGSMPSLPSFNPFDFVDFDIDIDPPGLDVSVDWDGAGSVISDWASDTKDKANEVIDYLEELQDFLEGPDATCRNWNRHDYQGARASFQSSWAGWATAAQRGLGHEEPLSWQQMIDSHNAYNSFVDGYILPNQYYTLSDQLDLGARSLELDPNYYSGDFRACHGKLDDLGCSPIDRLFDNALKEIRKWLDDHPTEVILLRLENYVEASERDDFLAMVDNRLGSKIYRQDFARTNPDIPLPTPRMMLKLGKQVIITTYHSVGSTSFFEQLVTERSVDEFFEPAPRTLANYRNIRSLCGPDVHIAHATNTGDAAPVVDALGDPVLGYDHDVAHDYGYAALRTYTREAVGEPLEKRRFEYRGCDAVATVAGGCEFTLDAGHCDHSDCGSCPIADGEQATCSWRSHDMGFDDKTAVAPAEILRVHESRPFDIGNVIDLDPGPSDKRLLDEESASILRACHVNLISVDFLQAKEQTPESTCILANVPVDQCRSSDHRTEATVWSWANGDRADNGDGTYQDRDGRWHSADVAEVHRYACMRPREPQPEAPVNGCLTGRIGGEMTWSDPDGADWCITPATGTWYSGGQLCLDGCEGYVFGAPRNGWQAQRLAETMADAGADKVWIAVDDIATEGSPKLNPRPWASFEISAGPYKEGSQVQFDASLSCDRDQEHIVYWWNFGGFGYGDSGVTPLWTWGGDSGAGEFNVSLVVDDGHAGADDVWHAVKVANVAPEVTLGGAVDALGLRIPEDVAAAVVGVPVSYAGSYSDVGWLDEQVATMAWGDGLTTQGGVSVNPIVAPNPRTGGIALSHVYAVPGPMTLAFTLFDGSDTVPIGKTLKVVDSAGAIGLARVDLLSWSGSGYAIRWLDQAVQRLALGDMIGFFDRLERGAKQLDWLFVPKKTKALVALAARSQANLAIARFAALNPLPTVLALPLAAMSRADAAFAAGQTGAAVHGYWLAWRYAYQYGGPSF